MELFSNLLGNFGLQGGMHKAAPAEHEPQNRPSEQARLAKSMPSSPRFPYRQEHPEEDHRRSPSPFTPNRTVGSRSVHREYYDGGRRSHQKRSGRGRLQSDGDEEVSLSASTSDDESDDTSSYGKYRSNGDRHLTSQRLTDTFSSRKRYDRHASAKGGGAISKEELDYYLDRPTASQRSPRGSSRHASSPYHSPRNNHSFLHPEPPPATPAPPSASSKSRQRAPLAAHSSPRDLSTPSFAGLMNEYRKLRVEHDELQEVHHETLLYVERLKSTASQLERAVRDNRDEELLRESNAMLRDEVKDKDRVIAGLRIKVEALTSRLRNDGVNPEDPVRSEGSLPSSRMHTPRGGRGGGGVQSMRSELDAIRADHLEEMARRRRLEEEVKALVLMRRGDKDAALTPLKDVRDVDLNLK